MAQETTPTETEPTEPAQGGGEGQEPDYKALYENALKESRKWESRSKANLKELDELKAAAPKADPTVEERLSALESENASLKASAARSELVDSVAKATGLDRSIVATLNGEDEDALTEQAKAVAAIAKPAGGAPKVPEATKLSPANPPEGRPRHRGQEGTPGRHRGQHRLFWKKKGWNMPDIKTLAAARNVDLVNTFTKSLNKLTAMLHLRPHPGGRRRDPAPEEDHRQALPEAEYTEGQDIPLSTYSFQDVKTYEVELKPYRKQTTLQEVKKRGYDAAVDKTDAAMLSDIQRVIKKDFVAALGAEGTTAATGKSLVATAANAWAALSNLVEDYGFGDAQVVYFVNPVDFAKQIGESEVFSAFGIATIELGGLRHARLHRNVAAGTIYATVKDNVKVYVAPTDGDELFGCYTDESGYIAVSHSAELKSLTTDAVAYVGLVRSPSTSTSWSRAPSPRPPSKIP